jgi:prepilin-type processing-associated H-X9-DG protein
MVELLVVLGIIVVLVSALMPAVGQARRHANATLCISNLRQLGAAYQAYLRDNHGMSMGGPGHPDPYWMIVLGPYINGFKNPYDPASGLPRSPTYVQQMANLPNLPAAWFCPDAPASNVCPGEPIGNSNAEGGAWGSATVPWGPGTYTDINYIAGSYGMNGWLYDLNASQTVGVLPVPVYYSGIQYYTGADAQSFFMNIRHHRLRDADQIPVFGDCNWHEAWPLNCMINGVAVLDYPPTNLDEGARYNTTIGSRGPNWGQMGRFCIARHGHSINLVFMDGHTETVPIRNLWGLKWSASSRKFAPPAALSGNP